jgi:hypothetical protein
VLQNASGPGPFFTGPGLVLRFETAGVPPTVVANCFDRPTSTVLDGKTGALYVLELLTGRLVSVPVSQ